MSGRASERSLGQLALMDAIVFFAIAIAISSILFFYVREDMVSPQGPPNDSQSDPDAVLRVLLRSSLGADITLRLNEEVRISGNSEILECIVIELRAIALGTNLTDFALLNDRYMSVLHAVCSPAVEPFLVALEVYDGSSNQLFSLPGPIPDSGTRFASSTRLPGDQESSFLLILVLVPTSSASPSS